MPLRPYAAKSIETVKTEKVTAVKQSNPSWVETDDIIMAETEPAITIITL